MDRRKRRRTEDHISSTSTKQAQLEETAIVILSDSSDSNDSVVELNSEIFSASLPLPKRKKSDTPEYYDTAILGDDANADSEKNKAPTTQQPKPVPLNRAKSATADISITPSGDLTNERLSYLQIFDHIMDTVLEGESHLFSDKELLVLRAFKGMERHSRYVYTRLYMRKRGWIRVSGLNYGEPESVKLSCQYLGARSSTRDSFVMTDSDLTDCEQALMLLTLPELKLLAKDRGVKKVNGKPKETICSEIMKGAKQRTVLSFFGKKDKEADSASRLSALVQQVIKVTGPLVNLHPIVAELFERIHLVFFRTPMYLGDDNPMKVAVLATIGQIRFPDYQVIRSTDLFTSRDDVVQYKVLMDINSEMSELGMSPISKREDHQQGWDVYTQYRTTWEQHVQSLLKAASAVDQLPSQSSAATQTEDSAIKYWRRHFTPGYALARIVEKGAKFAANLKNYTDEVAVVESLLRQSTYRLGRRGEWYERLILLYATHLRPKHAKRNKEAQEKIRETLNKARDVCIQALEDRHVTRISLHAISKQLCRIEDKLKLEEQSRCQHPRLMVELKAAPERTFHGRRLMNTSGRSGGPSMWDGDEGTPCSVENFALWKYESLGYKGLHSENAVITTLFSLLFWDIIFYPIPGVLDTEYQSRPLDMNSESFYYSRQVLIDQRLNKIADGQFVDYIQTHYQREEGTECVGVSWELTCHWLVRVAEYMGGEVLSAICKVLAKEYRFKCSGFPDLCLLNTDTKQVLFAEVKGPNDKLSDSQHDWIDILLSNGIDVELCLVREAETS